MLNLPPSHDDALRGVFASALAMVRPPAPGPLHKMDALNITCRSLAANASQSLIWPIGSRGRNYAEFWLSLKSLEVLP